MSHIPTTTDVYLGPRNVEAYLGLSWRRTRDLAIRLGVPRIPAGRAKLIRLADLREAIERDAGPDAVADAADPTDPRATVLAALGRRPA